MRLSYNQQFMRNEKEPEVSKFERLVKFADRHYRDFQLPGAPPPYLPKELFPFGRGKEREANKDKK